jgi:hypothetical protein
VHAPEDVFFVFDEVKHQGYQEVVALVVAQLAVNIAISKNDVAQLLRIRHELDSFFLVDKDCRTLAYGVIIDEVLQLLVFDFDQFREKGRLVAIFELSYVKQVAPDAASVLVVYSFLFEQVEEYSISVEISSETLLLFYNIKPVCLCKATL